MTIERTQQHLYELNTESRLTKLETTNELILKTLIEINTKIDKNSTDINKKIDTVLIELNTKMDKLDNRLWYLYAWTGAGFAGLFAIMAHGFHWF